MFKQKHAAAKALLNVVLTHIESKSLAKGLRYRAGRPGRLQTFADRLTGGNGHRSGRVFPARYSHPDEASTLVRCPVIRFDYDVTQRVSWPKQETSSGQPANLCSKWLHGARVKLRINWGKVKHAYNEDTT